MCVPRAVRVTVTLVPVRTTEDSATLWNKSLSHGLSVLRLGVPEGACEDEPRYLSRSLAHGSFSGSTCLLLPAPGCCSSTPALCLEPQLAKLTSFMRFLRAAVTPPSSESLAFWDASPWWVGRGLRFLLASGPSPSQLV